MGPQRGEGGWRYRVLRVKGANVTGSGKGVWRGLRERGGGGGGVTADSIRDKGTKRLITENHFKDLSAGKRNEDFSIEVGGRDAFGKTQIKMDS